MTTRSTFPVLMWCAATACQTVLEPLDDSGAPIGGTEDVDTREPDTDADTELDTDLGDGNMEWVRGDLTWTMDFDAAAEAAGLQDCSYVRHYEAGEDTANAWLCPDCDMLYRADVRFISGLEDCYRQLWPTNPSPDEMLGRRGGDWMRSRSYNRPTTRAGTSHLGGLTWDVAASGTAGLDAGSVTYTITGTLDRSRRDGDTSHGWAPPETYACGWPQNAEATIGPATLAVGQPLPDVALLDICDEPVRLHDLLDGYMILYTAATDCVMCRDMAADQVAFEATLADLPWDVTIVGVVAPSLESADDTLSVPALSAWISSFSLQNKPVFRDRGIGLHVMGDVFPTSVVVAPDGTVIDVAHGYAGSWDYWGLQIDQHLHGED